MENFNVTPGKDEIAVRIRCYLAQLPNATATRLNSLLEQVLLFICRNCDRISEKTLLDLKNVALNGSGNLPQIVFCLFHDL
jgi:hypothetical protein